MSFQSTIVVAVTAGAVYMALDPLVELLRAKEYLPRIDVAAIKQDQDQKQLVDNSNAYIAAQLAANDRRSVTIRNALETTLNSDTRAEVLRVRQAKYDSDLAAARTRQHLVDIAWDIEHPLPAWTYQMPTLIMPGVATPSSEETRNSL